ncbi:MAG: N-carbamoylputrescine amidase, partial [Pseudoalteromonas distincta]
MTRLIKVAAIQTAYGLDLDANIKKTADFIRQAADQ